jgi:CDGSH-type Zn-finger protein
VTFPDGSHDELGFDSHELAAPAPQEPAPVSAAAGFG